MALTEVPELGPVRQASILASFEDVQSLFRAGRKDLASRTLLKDFQVHHIKNIDWDVYDQRFRESLKHGVRVVDFKDPAYPRRLLHMASPPLLLYYRGELSILHKRCVLGVVGSRRMTEYGRRVIQKFVPELVEKGVVIVSGLAFGVDGEAHGATIKSNGLTAAVLAAGVVSAQPHAQQGLFDQIIARGGCVVSEFSGLEGWDPEPFHFPRRNRLISGLSDGVLVVEAGQKSGALITARYALEQNREVFAVPGNIFQPLSEGCVQLIGHGAKPVQGAKDVLCEFKLAERDAIPPLFGDDPVKIATDHFESPLEKKIFDLCLNEPQTFDVLVESAEEPASFVSAVVTKMVLMGKIREMTGKRFVAEGM